MRQSIFALIGLLSLCPTLVSAAPTPPITLSATLEQPVCREGQHVVLALSLHNGGTERLIIDGSAFEESSFQISVTNSAGKAVPRTAVGERVLTSPMAVSANATVAITPGQNRLYRFNLARLFDLSRSGTYSINVSRRLIPQVWPPETNTLASPPPKTSPVTPPPAITMPRQEFTLTAEPLTVRMVEDAAATSGPTAFAAPPGHQTFLYVVGRYDEGVSHYLIREDGSLSFSMAYSQLSSPRVAKGADSLAATPDGRFLYAANETNHTVSQFRIGDDGALFPLSPPTVPSYTIPGALLMDPKGRFLYNLSGTVYAIGSDGRLAVTVSFANNPPGKIEYSNKGNVVASYYGVLDPTGTYLYGCGAMTGGYHLAPDGTILAPPPPSQTVGPDGGNTNAVAVSPSGKFAYVGVSTTFSSAFYDRVVPMRVGPDGSFTPIPGAVLTPKSPPLPWPGFQPFLCQALAVDPTGHLLVVVNQGYLDCYRIKPDGSLSFLNMMMQGGRLTSIFFGPVGHLGYALNSNGNTLTAFRFDDQHGLTPSGLEVTDAPFDACMTSAVAPTPLKWGPVSGGLSLSARLPGDVLSSNAPVVVTVTVKNVTKHPIRLSTAGMNAFRLSLAGPQRQGPGMLQGDGEPLAGPVPLLAAGHDLLDTPGVGGAELMLPSGGERQYRFVLSRLADMTVAGHYTVQFTYILPGGAAAASPPMPFLLDGPFDGIIRSGNRSEVDIL